MSYVIQIRTMVSDTTPPRGNVVMGIGSTNEEEVITPIVTMALTPREARKHAYALMSAAYHAETEAHLTTALREQKIPEGTIQEVTKNLRRRSDRY